MSNILSKMFFMFRESNNAKRENRNDNITAQNSNVSLPDKDSLTGEFNSNENKTSVELDQTDRIYTLSVPTFAGGKVLLNQEEIKEDIVIQNVPLTESNTSKPNITSDQLSCIDTTCLPETPSQTISFENVLSRNSENTTAGDGFGNTTGDFQKCIVGLSKMESSTIDFFPNEIKSPSKLIIDIPHSLDWEVNSWKNSETSNVSTTDSIEKVTENYLNLSITDCSTKDVPSSTSLESVAEENYKDKKTSNVFRITKQSLRNKSNISQLESIFENVASNKNRQSTCLETADTIYSPSKDKLLAGKDVLSEAFNTITLKKHVTESRNNAPIEKDSSNQFHSQNLRLLRKKKYRPTSLEKYCRESIIPYPNEPVAKSHWETSVPDDKIPFNNHESYYTDQYPDRQTSTNYIRAVETPIDYSHSSAKKILAQSEPSSERQSKAFGRQGNNHNAGNLGLNTPESSSVFQPFPKYYNSAVTLPSDCCYEPQNTTLTQPILYSDINVSSTVHNDSSAKHNDDTYIAMEIEPLRDILSGTSHSSVIVLSAENSNSIIKELTDYSNANKKRNSKDIYTSDGTSISAEEASTIVQTHREPSAHVGNVSLNNIKTVTSVPNQPINVYNPLRGLIHSVATPAKAPLDQGNLCTNKNTVSTHITHENIRTNTPLVAKALKRSTKESKFFYCPSCSNIYERNEDLLKHLRNHEHEKKLNCNLNKNSENNALKLVHLDGLHNKRKIQSPVIADDKGQTQYHQNDNEAPFVCIFKPKSFILKVKITTERCKMTKSETVTFTDERIPIQIKDGGSKGATQIPMSQPMQSSISDICRKIDTIKPSRNLPSCFNEVDRNSCTTFDNSISKSDALLEPVHSVGQNAQHSGHNIMAGTVHNEGRRSESINPSSVPIDIISENIDVHLEGMDDKASQHSSKKQKINVKTDGQNTPHTYNGGDFTSNSLVYPSLNTLGQTEPLPCSSYNTVLDERECQLGVYPSFLITNRSCKSLPVRYTCFECGKPYKRIHSFRNHLLMHHEKYYNCTSCQLTFKSRPKPNWSDNPTQNILCPECQVSDDDTYNNGKAKIPSKEEAKADREDRYNKFVEARNFILHGQIPELPYKCDICPRSFKKSCHLKHHVWVHEPKITITNERERGNLENSSNNLDCRSENMEC